MDNRVKNSRLLTLVVMAMLIGIVVVLQTVASGIKIGTIPVTLTLVPIVIGAIVYGPIEGGILGFIFGLITLIAGITGSDAFTFTLFGASPVWTSVLCLLKGTMAGVVPGLIYKCFKSKHTLGCIIASLTAPIVNTGIFVLGMMTVLRSSLISFAGDTDIYYFLFIVCCGVNFLVEASINIILGSAISRIALYFKSRLK